MSDHLLDVARTTSCGHTWTMRHTACPTCFAELRARVAKLEDQSRLREIDFALSETRVADLEMTLRPFAVGLIHRVEGVPIVAISEGELERARRLLGMEVER